jgi:hypothetical protein
MLGAIAGDIIGSNYEFRPIKTKDFPLFGEGATFTDDTVCTVAVADCILQEGDFATFLKDYGRRYPGVVMAAGLPAGWPPTTSPLTAASGTARPCA